MPAINPAAIIFDRNGNAAGVSGSMTLPTGAIGLLGAAIDNNNIIKFATHTSGALNVTMTMGNGTGSSGFANNISGAAVPIRAYDGRIVMPKTQPYPEYVLGVSLRTMTSSGSHEHGTSYHPMYTQPTHLGTSGFGEARVTQTKTLFDNTNYYEINQYEIGTSSLGGGTITYMSASSVIKLAVDNASGSVAAIRTNSWFRYQAGRAQLIRISGFSSDIGQTNQHRNFGYFDDDNGLFFRQNGTDVELVIRSSITGGPLETTIPRTSWNVDKLDGTGHDSFIYDATKGNIYEISAQWLGVGLVRWFVSEILVHISDFRNALSTGPYMRTAMLPLTYEIRNMAAITSTTGSLANICLACYSEGGQEDPRQSFSARNVANVVVTTAEIPILSISLKSTYAGRKIVC